MFLLCIECSTGLPGNEDVVSGLVKFFGDFALYYARYAHEVAEDVLVKVEATFDSIWRP